MFPNVNEKNIYRARELFLGNGWHALYWVKINSRFAFGVLYLGRIWWL